MQLIAGGSNHYYLIVPRNAESEGSYGLDSSEAERPRSEGACALAKVVALCSR